MNSAPGSRVSFRIACMRHIALLQPLHLVFFEEQKSAETRANLLVAPQSGEERLIWGQTVYVYEKYSSLSVFKYSI